VTGNLFKGFGVQLTSVEGESMDKSLLRCRISRLAGAAMAEQGARSQCRSRIVVPYRYSLLAAARPG
jgi:hypothetical protein